LKKRAKEEAKDRILSDDELRVLWGALVQPEAVTCDVADALRFILLTGQRPGEVAGMSQGEIIDFRKPAGARWEIPAERTKARRPHVVPLAPTAMEVLSAALVRRLVDGDGSSVFASKFASRVTLARHSLSQGLKRLIERMKADDGADADAVRSLQGAPPTPHDLRRTLATGLARLGIPREDRLAVLGHAADDVHGRHYDKYARLKEKRAALEAWERQLSLILGGEILTPARGPIGRT